MMTEEWTRSILDAAYAPMIGALPPGAATIVQSLVHDYGNTLTAYNRLEVAARAVVEGWDSYGYDDGIDEHELETRVEALRAAVEAVGQDEDQ